MNYETASEIKIKIKDKNFNKNILIKSLINIKK
jgi:hypothetical protein